MRINYPGGLIAVSFGYGISAVLSATNACHRLPLNQPPTMLPEASIPNEHVYCAPGVRESLDGAVLVAEEAVALADRLEFVV